MHDARMLIVDGYNVIRQTPPYRDLAERDDLDAARTALIADVAAYAHGVWESTIVFDGGGNPLSTGEPHTVAGVRVIFSPFGVTADSIIESLAREARSRGAAVDVVTSDAQTQWAVVGGSVARRSSAEFARELRLDEQDREDHRPLAKGRVPIEDRIAEDVRLVLERWARGEG